MTEKIRKLGFGCMRLPLKDAEDQKSVDFSQLCQMVDMFLEKGFTYFDTAYMYHDFQSEIFLRRALVERHPRDSYTIATKMPIMFLKSEADNMRIFNEQLEKCGVDYFDYYLLHNINAAHYKAAEKYHSFAFIQEEKEAGRIREIGFSHHDNAKLLDRVLTEHPEVDFVQLQMNYLDWDHESIQSRKCYEIAVKHGKKVIVMEPVRGGALAKVPEKAEKLMKAVQPEMSVPSWAIRFAAGHENVMIVLSGMSTFEQLTDNIGYMENFQPLVKKEYEILKQVVGIINEATAIPCTACRYCMGGCPKDIPIPEYFALYNAETQNPGAMFSIQKVYYGNYADKHGKASDCIECGQCEKNCPQHLDIMQYLTDVQDVFEEKRAEVS